MDDDCSLDAANYIAAPNPLHPKYPHPSTLLQQYKGKSCVKTKVVRCLVLVLRADVDWVAYLPNARRFVSGFDYPLCGRITAIMKDQSSFILFCNYFIGHNWRFTLMAIPHKKQGFFFNKIENYLGVFLKNSLTCIRLYIVS